MTAPKPQQTTILAVLALYVFAATAINLSWVQRYQNADSLLSALISIDHYTPFYWSENRFGQPAPLITSFIHDYTANLFAQTEILVLASLGSVIVFNLFFLHASLSRVQRLAAALLAITLSLCVLTPAYSSSQMLAIGAQPYMHSLFLVLIALALLFRVKSVPGWIRLAGSMACLLLAFWLNASVTSITLGLILCLDLRLSDTQWKLRLAGLLILAVAAAVNIWFASQYSGPHMLTFEPVSGWIFAAQKLWGAAWSYFFHTGRLLIFLILLLLIVVTQIVRNGIQRNYQTRDLLVFLLAAICFAVVIARLEWVKLNLYDPRYWTIPVMLLLLLATAWMSSAFIRLFTNILGSETIALFLAGALLAGAVINMFGFPSYANAKKQLAESITLYDNDERALGCTHFLGNYQIAWTSVFQRESSGGPPLYAISDRSQVTRDRWDWDSRRPRTYCGVPGDPTREMWRQVFKLPPLIETARAGPLCRLEVVSSDSAAQAALQRN
jgi:hypothetical protein